MTFWDISISSIIQHLNDVIDSPITIKTSGDSTRTNYYIVAQDGKYIEKQKFISTTTIKTIDDGSWCNGHQVPILHYERVAF